MTEERLKRIEETVCDIHRRLFIDNGNPCIQTRINRHDTVINVLTWVAGSAGTASIAIIVAMIFGQ